MMLRRSSALFGTESVRGKNPRKFGNIVCFRARLRAALAVENDIPHDADQPDAMIANLAERVTMTQNAQEGFLHGVFGVARFRRTEKATR